MKTRISQLIEETEKKQSELLTQAEIEKAKDAFKDSGLDNYPINFDDYLKLLLVTQAASKLEQASLPTVEQNEIAKEHAKKLLIAFGSLQHVIQYLEKYEAKHPEEKQLVHDACLFSLAEDGWNVALWQKILLANHPGGPSDLIMRLLPFAGKIEAYIEKNENKLKESMREETEEKYKNKFLSEYSKLSLQSREDWVKKELNDNAKMITAKVQQDFTHYLKSELGIPSGKGTTYQAKVLKQRKENLTNVDKEMQKKIREKIEMEYSIQFADAYNNKDQYVRYQLEKNAKHIQDVLKTKKLLTATTPVTILKSYAKNCVYANADKNPAAAELFFTWGMTEESFNRYLTLKAHDDSELIPKIKIDGSEISDKYEKFYIKKLDPSDPSAAALGKMTSCCQFLGGAGDSCVVHGITDPSGGFYVLCQKIPSQSDKIVAQCWAWRDSEGVLVFDSIESHMDFRKVETNKNLIADFYTYLAYRLVKDSKVPWVLAGTGGGTASVLTGHLMRQIKAYPSNRKIYRDSHEQILLAHPKLPLLQFYLQNHSASELSSITESISLDKSETEEWCDICFINKVTPEIKDYPVNFMLTHEEMEDRKQHTAEWLDNIEHISEKNTWEKLQKLIGKINLNLYDRKGRHALSWAALGNQWEIIAYLIENGADINARTRDGSTVLHFFYVDVDAEDVFLMTNLIKNGAAVNVKDKYGDTPLHGAAQNGRWDRVLSLINNGADINEKDQFGVPALFYAIKSADLNIIIKLIERGAEPDIKNQDGDTCLLIAANCGTMDIVKYFIENGANFHEKNYLGVTTLHNAALGDNLELVNYFIEKGLDINVKDNSDNTALHYVTSFFLRENKNRWLIVNYLIDHGIDINVKNSDGKTAFSHLAEQASSDQAFDVIRKMIKDGAIVTDKDKLVYYERILHDFIGKWIYPNVNQNSKLVKEIDEIYSSDLYDDSGVADFSNRAEEKLKNIYDLCLKYTQENSTIHSDFFGFFYLIHKRDRQAEEISAAMLKLKEKINLFSSAKLEDVTSYKK